MSHKRSLALVGTAVLALLAVAVVSLGPRNGGSAARIALWTLHREPFRDAEFRQVVSDIVGGKLSPDPFGTVNLPSSQSRLTRDGRAYVTRVSDGDLLVLFPAWRGKGSNFEGYLYHRGPLHLMRSSSGPSTVAAVGPAIPTTPYLSKTGDSLVLTVEREVKADWVYVSYRLD